MPLLTLTPSLLRPTPLSSYHSRAIYSAIIVRPFYHSKHIGYCCTTDHLHAKSASKKIQPVPNFEDKSRRSLILFLLASLVLQPDQPTYAKSKGQNPYDERRLLDQNKRRQKENNVPDDFPNFIREGFQVKVIASENYVKRDNGLIYKDFEVGDGDCPSSGQQVTFHYIGYNESGRRIDSSYLQGRPAKIRMGTNALVPGFEDGIRDMKPGGKRRIVIPPELGPPVGPSTFFSSKQFEVFDVELLSVKDCQRRTIAFYSDVVCD